MNSFSKTINKIKSDYEEIGMLEDLMRDLKNKRGITLTRNTGETIFIGSLSKHTIDSMLDDLEEKLSAAKERFKLNIKLLETHHNA